MKRSLLISFTLLGLALAVAARQKKASETDPYLEVNGGQLYKTYCASCHGADGKGTGPAAEALKPRPSDLTTIARRSGGKYPDFRIGHIINGDEVILAHGAREMPVWGDLLPQRRDEALLKLREYNLTEYVRTLQK